MSKFYQGQDNIETLCFDSGNIISVEGQMNIDRIKVQMENGQMAGVPWFECYSISGKLISKWNAALVQGVIFKEETKYGDLPF